MMVPLLCILTWQFVLLTAATPLILIYFNQVLMTTEGFTDLKIITECSIDVEGMFRLPWEEKMDVLRVRM